MASKASLANDKIDSLLKAVMTFSRTVDYVLEARPVESVTDFGLSRSKVQLIRLLGTQGRQTATQTARFLGVSNPAVSQIIDSMVERGLIERRSGSSDRREVVLVLTRAGRRLFQAVRQRQRHLLRSALRVSPGSLSSWLETFHEATMAVAKAESAFQDFCLQCGAHTDGTCVLDGGPTNCPFLRSLPKSGAREPPDGVRPPVADRTKKTTRRRKRRE